MTSTVKIGMFMPQITELSRKHNVKELYLFGSVLTPRFNDDSDVDFAVTFIKENISDFADNYFEFKDSLAYLLGRDVDLVELDALRNQYFKKELDTTKRLIYAS